ncbi:hypothetical protein like AT1G22100 [Hibiscus trionum]|uniref:Inositol-pentakisphosphate 2-kinase n=1 Tax=Hibiscus trionum TaxID=183268 RepID=A0A9W7HTM1_HIBTR|nr:hypothetical protein like AT1G22100 [Hibiscus trionum]
MEEVILEQKDAGDWIYRGEGAANLILAYTGSSPAFIGKVMRIQKSQRNGKTGVKGSRALTTHERLVWRENEELTASPNREIVEQLYVKHVMSPLLGPKHVDVGIRVHVAKEFLKSVEKNVTFHRPAWRVDSSQVDLNRDSVLILSDHSVFPTGSLKDEPCITVEIKPKCGFLPISRFIAEENAVKKTVVRFRMHQALKLLNQEVSEYSKYNPLELFSGSREGIQKAIEALYATPQNNFRVFFNGSIVFGSLGGGTDRTTALVGEAFEDTLKNIIQAENGQRTTSFIQLVAETIYASGALDKLLEVQKLDTHDIEGAIHAYYNITSQPCMVCRELSKDKLSCRYTSLHSIPLDESLKIVKDYLIAATAKDCSLMISFRPKEDGRLPSHNTVYLGSTDQVFEYKVYFIDLDLKPLKKMEAYYELDKKIVSCYSQMVKTEHETDKAVRMNSNGSVRDQRYALEDSFLNCYTEDCTGKCN